MHHIKQCISGTYMHVFVCICMYLVYIWFSISMYVKNYVLNLCTSFNCMYVHVSSCIYLEFAAASDAEAGDNCAQRHKFLRSKLFIYCLNALQQGSHWAISWPRS